MKDYLIKATAEGVRIYALVTTSLVQEANERHQCSHLSIAALGRAMNGALLFAATMKDNERVTLRFSGDGPLGDVVADAEGTHVRGYVDNPNVFLPLKKGNNQLVIVYYNGFEKEFSYNITPLEQWSIYSQKLSPIKLDTDRDFHTLSVRDAQPISNVEPLRMSNIQVNIR